MDGRRMILARVEEGETSQRAVHQRGEARGVDGRARSSSARTIVVRRVEGHAPATRGARRRDRRRSRRGPRSRPSASCPTSWESRARSRGENARCGGERAVARGASLAERAEARPPPLRSTAVTDRPLRARFPRVDAERTTSLPLARVMASAAATAARWARARSTPRGCISSTTAARALSNDAPRGASAASTSERTSLRHHRRHHFQRAAEAVVAGDATTSRAAEFPRGVGVVERERRRPQRRATVRAPVAALRERRRVKSDDGKSPQGMKFTTRTGSYGKQSHRRRRRRDR